MPIIVYDKHNGGVNIPSIADIVTTNVKTGMTASPKATFGEIMIIGEDGNKVETQTPMGVDSGSATATAITGVKVRGISQFTGLEKGIKTLAYTESTDMLVWDGGEAVDVSGAGAGKDYTLYDSGGSNFMIVNVIYANLPGVDTSDATIDIEEGVYDLQITVHKFDDPITSGAPVFVGADGVDITTAGGTYPYADADSYAILSTDKRYVAIAHGGDSPSPITDVSVTYQFYNTSRLYTTLSAVATDHGSTSEIYKAATSALAAGAAHFNIINTKSNTTGTLTYATCLATLENEGIDYDIMVPCIDIGTTSAVDANFQLMATHAITYKKVLICPLTNMSSATDVRTAFGKIATPSDCMWAVAYKDDTYTAATLAGDMGGSVAVSKPWISMSYCPSNSIGNSTYTRAQIDTMENIPDTGLIRINTVTKGVGKAIYSSGKALAPGTFLHRFRATQYADVNLDNVVTDLIVRSREMGRNIPYTNGGIAQVVSVISTECGRFQSIGMVAEDDDAAGTKGFTISYPHLKDISDADIVAGNLPDIEVMIYLAGAIETVNPLSIIVSLAGLEV